MGSKTNIFLENKALSLGERSLLLFLSPSIHSLHPDHYGSSEQALGWKGSIADNNE